MNLFRLKNGNSTNQKLTKRALVLIPLVLVCFGLSPIARAADGDLGHGNTNEGSGALLSLTTGIHNTALGFQAQFSNAIGNYNTATGSQALKNNTTDKNTADGFQALAFNTAGVANVATGFRALYSNTMGDDNTAIGIEALFNNTTADSNTAVGADALFFNTAENNTAVGSGALAEKTTGIGNIALGANAGSLLTTGDNNIDIGNFGVAGEAGTIRIGTVGDQTKTFIAGIFGATVTGATVAVTSNGQLGVVGISSARFKDEIKPMNKASEAIFALKPVTFHYKKQIDPKGTAQFGLVAEEVEKVNPDLITRDRDGKPYTVRYDAVNAMLLNEFLKEHRKVQELESGMTALIATVKEQASQIQKVSAQLEVSKPAPQTVLNNP